MKWIRACEPRPLVIVDSLAAFLNGDENDAGEMRRFTHQLRRLADIGATVIVIHHDGKSETARDYRGSSDFKASLDVGFHVTNSSGDMRLDRLRLRCFKSRHGFTGELVYAYALGRFIRDEDRHAPARTVTDQFRDLLRLNPGSTGADFEAKAFAEGIARARVREFLNDGVLDGSIECRTASHNAKRYLWVRGGFE